MTVGSISPLIFSGPFRYAAGARHPWLKGVLPDSILKSWLTQHRIKTELDTETQCYKVLGYCDSIRGDSSTGLVLENMFGFTIYYLNFDDRRLFVKTYVVDQQSKHGVEITELGMEIGRFNADVANLTIEQVLPKHGLSSKGYAKLWSKEFSDRVEDEINTAKFRVPDSDDSFEGALGAYQRHKD